MNLRKRNWRNTLHANERLKGRKEIEMLFRDGKAFSFYPLKVVYRAVANKDCRDAYAPVRMGVSVPKKSFKRANKRNQNKRMIREAWRTQKQVVYEQVPDSHQLHLFFLYKSKEMLTFEEAQILMRAVIEKLILKLPNIFDQSSSDSTPTKV